MKWRIIETSRESNSHVFLVSLCGSTTSEYRIRFLVILKSYQFIVQINVFGEMLAYCCDTETTYQSFLWFYTSLRDHYNSGGKQSYSTLIYSIFFHHELSRQETSQWWGPMWKIILWLKHRLVLNSTLSELASLYNTYIFTNCYQTQSW